MLTVWCVLWGDKYDHYYVQRLKRETEKYLTIKHQFKCLSDQSIEGVETVPQITDKPGWWQKIDLFSPGFCGDYNLFLDLDIILTSNLDNMLLQYAGSHLACASNWAASGHGGCQSSVMIWKGGKGCQAETIYRLFDPKDAHWPPRNEPGYYWGDQEFITHLRDTGHLAVTHFAPELIQSYKYHCQGKGLPGMGCLAVIFHGLPNPPDVVEDWFKW
jgi:hypothetical protein